ncbi:hypothetical protein Tco_1124812 [Tanacetum coccineum]|uniref:Uncharacterized protein n=1 Tax=Tanacetum coccineum TaxID=301880 RepID=A0ABQ5J771_9ASTR
MAPNVEVNLRGLLELGKRDLSIHEYRDQLSFSGAYSFVSYPKIRKNTISSPQGVIPGPTLATELTTPDLICPSTYQLLRSPSSGSGPDVSFDMSVSLEHLLGSARARLAEVSKLRLFSGLLRETIPHQ